MREYRCLFNHELLILFTSQTPYQQYREPVSDAQAVGTVRELAGTQVDALMCCPQAWMTPAWHSEVDRKWQDEAPLQQEPLPECDWKYYEKAYYRMRRYMLREPAPDPVALTLNTAREIGLGAFLSYRMNEIHYLQDEACPTHSAFWRERRDCRIQPGGARHRDRPVAAPLNYLLPEVRDRYYAILSELVGRYDIDGLELDFQRHPWLFPDDGIDEGREALTSFVARIRKRLDEEGERRNKRLLLGVRVPHTLERCARAGIDPAAWDRNRLLDMVNVSPHFRTSLEVDIPGFKKAVPNSRVYGEMHFITQSGQAPSGFTNNIHRRTPREVYETCALSFLDRGADGLSFFNFSYVRDHSFGEPRRREYPGQEPPFDALRRILDTDYLRGRPKHYVITPGFDLLPAALTGAEPVLRLPLHVADSLGPGHSFHRAALRIESGAPGLAHGLSAAWNGRPLDPYPGQGELFEPFSLEALPPPERLAHFRVPLEAVRHGANEIRLEHEFATGRNRKALPPVVRAELALYTGS